MTREMSEELFSHGKNVWGMALFEFLQWANASNDALSKKHDWPVPEYGVLALPPVQRTAVWNPKQVIDLWDSLFRGLPIGSFFLVKRSGGRSAQVRGMRTGDRMVPVGQDGFDLLDGQQRMRAMLLGRMGPVIENRYLWVDLGAEARSHHIRIHLTSASQPFGYQPENGQKLPIADRRKAREHLEQDKTYNELLKKSGHDGAKRSAYDHELFELFLHAMEHPHPAEPPRPHRASPLTYPLHSLLNAWCKGEADGKQGMTALKHVFDSLQGREAPPESRIQQLGAAFRRIADAQVALLQVDPTTFERGNDEGRAHESLLMLFDRIGAGGTRLTDEERLFSIYKHHQPLIHDLVLGTGGIYDKVGRVLPPTKIVASALRIANARSHRKSFEGNTVPDVVTFAREMAEAADEKLPEHRTRLLKQELEELVLANRIHGEGKLVVCFDVLFELLAYERENALGLPRVMRTTLSPQLVQVLLFWVFLVRETAGGDKILKNFREDAIRFVMFWRLCIWNEDKASTHCFELLRSRVPLVGSVLPDLYRDLLTKDYVVPLATPEEMEAYGRHDSSPNWLREEDRFPKKDQAPVDLYRTWWRSHGNFLMWLQRDYLEMRFQDFDPAAGREDDVPYDLDHMCPTADWARNWTTFEAILRQANCLSEDQLRSMRQARSVLGNAIGNFRLIDASQNKGDQDDDILKKMPFVGCDVEPSECDLKSMTEMAFNPDQRAVWRLASGKDKQWDKERLCAFQEAVEERTHWLYRRFYEDLGFERWTESSIQVNRPSSTSET